MITELSYLLKGNTFAVESHTVLLGTLTSALSPASAFWRLMTMKDREDDWTARGQYFCLATIPIKVLRDYRKCKLCWVQFPFRESDPVKTSPHSAGSALSSAVQDALGLCGKGTLLAYTHLVHQDSHGLFLQSHPSAWPGAWGWSSPGTGLCSSLCWTSQGSCLTISSTHWGHPRAMVCQQLPLLEHLNLLRVQFPAVIQVSNEEVKQPWPQ